MSYFYLNEKIKYFGSFYLGKKQTSPKFHSIHLFIFSHPNKMNKREVT